MLCKFRDKEKSAFHHGQKLFLGKRGLVLCPSCSVGIGWEDKTGSFPYYGVKPSCRGEKSIAQAGKCE